MLQAVIDRLLDTTDLTIVLPAEDLDSLENGTQPKNLTVFVLPFRDVAAPNDFMAGAHRQEIAAFIIVAFIVRHYDDAKGGKRSSQFEATRNKIEGALAGWQWDAAEEPFELVSGQASAFARGSTIYAQTWRTTRTLEKR